MPQEMFPPVMSKKAEEETNEEITLSIIEACSRMLGRGKANYDDARFVGKQLNRLKERMGNGFMKVAKERFPVPERTLRSWMVKAKKPERQIGNLAELEEATKPEAEETSETVSPPTAQPAVSSNPWTFDKTCDDCRRSGATDQEPKKNNCRDCAEKAKSAPAPVQSGNADTTAPKSGEAPEGQAGAGSPWEQVGKPNGKPRPDAGADDPEPEHKLLNMAVKLPDLWAKKIDAQALVHDVSKGVVQAAKAGAQQLATNYEKIVRAPIRQAEPPSPAKCKHCGDDVFWATTQSGKRMMVIAGDGDLALVANRLTKVPIEPGTDMSRVYKRHFCGGMKGNK